MCVVTIPPSCTTRRLAVVLRAAYRRLVCSVWHTCARLRAVSHVLRKLWRSSNLSFGMEATRRMMRAPPCIARSDHGGCFISSLARPLWPSCSVGQRIDQCLTDAKHAIW